MQSNSRNKQKGKEERSAYAQAPAARREGVDEKAFAGNERHHEERSVDSEDYHSLDADDKVQPAKAKGSEQAKLKARREANRMHAFKSRQRSKMLFTELQQTVEQLNSEKADLEKAKAALTAQVEVLQEQNSVLLQNQQQMMAQQMQMQQLFSSIMQQQQVPAGIQPQLQMGATAVSDTSSTKVGISNNDNSMRSNGSNYSGINAMSFPTTAAAGTQPLDPFVMNMLLASSQQPMGQQHGMNSLPQQAPMFQNAAQQPIQPNLQAASAVQPPAGQDFLPMATNQQATQQQAAEVASDESNKVFTETTSQNEARD